MKLKTSGPNSITRSFFFLLFSEDHICWFESNSACNVRDAAAAHLADVVGLSYRDIHCFLCRNGSWPLLLRDMCGYFILISSQSLSPLLLFLSLPLVLPLSAVAFLFISLFCWCSLILCLIADSLRCFDLSYGTDKAAKGAHVCLCSYVHMHTHTFMPC